MAVDRAINIVFDAAVTEEKYLAALRAATQLAERAGTVTSTTGTYAAGDGSFAPNVKLSVAA